LWKALKNTNVERLAVVPSEEEVIRWLQVFKTKLEMAGLRSPAHDDLIKIMFKAYLPTEMSLWASNYGGQLTWDEMQEQFLKEFAPTRSSDVAKQDAWESLKQGAGESIQEYTRRFRDLLHRMLGHVPTVEEQNCHYTRFYRGLLLDYRDFLAGRFVNDVAHAVEAVTSRDCVALGSSAPPTRRPRFGLEVVDERPSGSEEE